jgi:hypothetical protein
MYLYRVFRLIVIALLITYFLGCFWYLLCCNINTQEDIDNENTFNTRFGLVNDTDYTKLIISGYYVLSTLSTVGYGDYYPISTTERLLSIVIMLCGVAFFSYIMNSFIDIL